MAVEWVSESIKSQYPIVLTVTHDELLAEIKKRTLSELGLTTSESEDIVGGEGHNPPGNGASEVDEEISPASPAGRTATTPDEMAASAQSPPATSQSEIGVSQGLFESKDREPTAAGDEFMSDAEIYEDSGNPGQQSLVDLMAKDSPEGSARGDVDEDMEDAVRESRL